MAPWVPEEVDVFTIPHSRMKELVNDYVQLLQQTNFTRLSEMERLLESLCRTFAEFKTHEQIENKLIMKKLKTKLKELSITCTAVCNCHKDNKLTEMLNFIKDGFNKKTVQDRVNFGLMLKHALEEFTAKFIPHMEEEEEVFGPMLMQYFTYDELQRLKLKVIEQHLVLKQLKEWGELQEAGRAYLTTSSDSDEEKLQKQHKISAEEKFAKESVPQQGDSNVSFDDLPFELQLQVFAKLSPRDLCHCAQVSHRWSALAMEPSLWKVIRPVQWSKGNWIFDECEVTDESVMESLEKQDAAEMSNAVNGNNDELSEAHELQLINDLKKETRVLRGLTHYVLPRVGSCVETLDLAGSRALTNPLLNRFLKLCPSISTLNLAETRVSEGGLVNLARNTNCRLKDVSFAGCVNVSDALLVRLAIALSGGDNNGRLNPSQVRGDVSSQQECLCERFYQACHQKLGTACDDWLGQGGCCAHGTVAMDKNKAMASIDGNESIIHQANASESAKLSADEKVPCCQVRKANAGDCCMSKQSITDGQNVDKPNIEDVENAIAINKRSQLASSHLEVSDNGFDSKMFAVAEKNNDCSRSCDNCPNKVNGENVGCFAWSVKRLEEMSYRGCSSRDKLSKQLINETVENMEKQDFERLEPASDDLLNIGANNVKLTQYEYGTCKEPIELCDTKTEFSDYQSTLQRLDLSGCFQVTDTGLRSLFSSGQLHSLSHLDLSGCWRLSGSCLNALADAVPCLRGGQGVLSYCDNISGGPMGSNIVGCQNLQCSNRYCCRNGV